MDWSTYNCVSVTRYHYNCIDEELDIIDLKAGYQKGKVIGAERLSLNQLVIIKMKAHSTVQLSAAREPDGGWN